MSPAPDPGSIGLRAVQTRAEELLGPVAHPRVGAALALVEEAGEACKHVLEREVYGKTTDPDAFAGELADVVICVAELATRYGIDLDRAVQRKLLDLEKRVPGWVTTLGPALAAARARMD